VLGGSTDGAERKVFQSSNVLLDMSTPPTEFYSAERWQNWIDRIEDEDLDPEDEDSMRVLDLMQDDAAIAVAKVVAAYDDDTIDEEDALEKVNEIHEIVLSEPGFDDEEKLFFVNSVQTSLVVVFYAAEEYVHSGPAEDASIEEYVQAAIDAESQDEMEAALGYLAQAGTRIIDGGELTPNVGDDLEFGPVTDWLNGLASLQSAMEDPEVVEEEDEED
jgi:hypothetical protein